MCIIAREAKRTCARDMIYAVKFFIAQFLHTNENACVAWTKMKFLLSTHAYTQCINSYYLYILNVHNVHGLYTNMYDISLAVVVGCRSFFLSSFYIFFNLYFMILSLWLCIWRNILSISQSRAKRAKERDNQNVRTQYSTNTHTNLWIRKKENSQRKSAHNFSHDVHGWRDGRETKPVKERKKSIPGQFFLSN